MDLKPTTKTIYKSVMKKGSDRRGKIRNDKDNLRKREDGEKNHDRPSRRPRKHQLRWETPA